jgi:flagellar hook-basal body complex protein FliE
MSDVVNHPSHYQGKVECIDCLEAATEGLVGIEAVCTANAIKYLYRWKRKNGKTDLLKSVWYINRLIEHLETQESNSAKCEDELDIMKIIDEAYDEVTKNQKETAKAEASAPDGKSRDKLKEMVYFVKDILDQASSKEGDK